MYSKAVQAFSLLIPKHQADNVNSKSSGTFLRFYHLLQKLVTTYWVRVCSDLSRAPIRFTYRFLLAISSLLLFTLIWGTFDYAPKILNFHR